MAGSELGIGDTEMSKELAVWRGRHTNTDQTSSIEGDGYFEGGQYESGSSPEVERHQGRLPGGSGA